MSGSPRGQAGRERGDAHSDTQGGADSDAAYGGGFGAQRAFQSPTNSIMMWKELSPIEDGGRGHILAAAVVSF